MSNFLAIATVTAVLSDLLHATVPNDVSGAVVTTLRPDGNSGLTGAGVNIFLYQVTPNASWQNNDLPTRRGAGDLIQKPTAAIDLHYLLTFHGDDSKLEPQRVLGSTVRTLHACPIVTRASIRQTLANTNYSYLAASNLADAVELVKFSPLPLSLEELSKLWSVYFQTQYSLSIAYQATVILIESDEPARASLPVRARNVYVFPFRQPFIEEVRAKDEKPIRNGSIVLIKGKRLRGEITEIGVGGTTITPALADVSDTEITFTLPAGLRAGVQGLQVIQPMLLGTPPVPHRGVESNLAAFVLHPAIVKKADHTPDVTFTPAFTPPFGNTDPARPPMLAVKVEPHVGVTQRGVLLMNALDATASRAYSFDALRRDPTGDPDTDTLTFPIPGAHAGDYLLRVQVDGADSALELDPAAAEPLYAGPKVTIP